MEDWRKERIVRNEVSFRDINERLKQGMEQVTDNHALLEFICECGDRKCQEHVHLTPQEFEQVRLDSRRFAIVPGHVIPDTERVVATHERYDVVEKFQEAIELTDAADDRVAGDAGQRDD